MRTRVAVRYGGGELELEISDDGAPGRARNGAPSSGGHGLVGMRERVALYGGEPARRPSPGGRLRRARVAADRAVSIGVLIADDQALMRAGFRMVLEVEDDIAVVGEAANGEQAVDSAQRLKPDVVLMDIRMPELDGIAATRQIAAGTTAAARVLILTTFDLDEYVYDALGAGRQRVPAQGQLAGAARDRDPRRRRRRGAARALRDAAG